MKNTIYISFFIGVLFLSFKTFNADKKIKKITEIEYKVNNKMVIIDTICTNPFGCYQVNNFDKNGNQIDLAFFNKKKECVFKVINEYQGELYMGSKTLSSGKVFGFSKNYFSKDNTLIKTEEYQYGVLNTYTLFKYENKMLIEETVYGKNDSEISKTFYENGKVIKKTRNSQLFVFVEFFRYNKKNLLIERKKYREDSEKQTLLQSEVLQYDNMNRLIKTEISSNFPEVHLYEYDTFNHWIKKINYFEGEVYSVNERTIEYYK